MIAMPPNLIERYVGDDWTVGPIALTAGGAPFDATGAVVSAEVYAAYQAAPVATLVEGAGVTMAADRTTGVISELWVSRDVTSAIPAQSRAVGPAGGGRPASGYPTRIGIVVTDSLGRRRTWLIVPVLPLDRRTDLPSVIP